MKPLVLSTPKNGGKRCPAFIGAGALDELPGIIENLPTVDRCVVLYDKGIELVANHVSDMLGNCAKIAVTSTEDSKSLDQVGRICEDLLLNKATLQTVLICIGGGMLTDLGGFVASVYKRGIRHVHVPTTLLAMADASIGGRTSINLGKVKNMIGGVHHPVAMVMDTDVLKTLPDDALSLGLIEGVKAASVLNAELFGWLEENIAALLEHDSDTLATYITHAVRLKFDVIEGSHRNAELPLYLHFGHTIGHAIEALTNFDITHGKAVSIGMTAELVIANSKATDRIVKVIEMLGLPIHIPPQLTSKDVWEVMKHDKLTIGDTVRLAVPLDIGTGILQPVTADQLTTFMTS